MSRRICHCCVMLPREAHCPICDGAAPAEDVRAVGEEPVAWLVNDVPFTDAQSAQAFLGFSNYEVVPLYRRPQRPVLLPERKNETDPDFFSGPYVNHDFDEDRGYAEGWNACIDEFERLNK